jgi:hypothetical protein
LGIGGILAHSIAHNIYYGIRTGPVQPGIKFSDDINSVKQIDTTGRTPFVKNMWRIDVAKESRKWIKRCTGYIFLDIRAKGPALVDNMRMVPVKIRC